ncbi:MAG: hypothetical protein M1830_004464, partial [Pleopsidium flavum]
QLISCQNAIATDQTASEDTEVQTKPASRHGWTYTKDVGIAVILIFTNDEPIHISQRLTSMFGYAILPDDVCNRAAVLRANEDGKDTWRRVEMMTKDDALVVELLRLY